MGRKGDGKGERERVRERDRERGVEKGSKGKAALVTLIP